jgi:hypothetical protein
MTIGRSSKRIIDRFIKYPYPSNLITHYAKDYSKTINAQYMTAGAYTAD